MSTQSRLRRLEKLEIEKSPQMPACLIRTIVKPGEHGPVECGAYATILKGPNAGLELERGEMESREAFERRIDQLIEGPV